MGWDERPHAHHPAPRAHRTCRLKHRAATLIQRYAGSNWQVAQRTKWMLDVVTHIDKDYRCALKQCLRICGILDCQRPVERAWCANPAGSTSWSRRSRSSTCSSRLRRCRAARRARWRWRRPRCVRRLGTHLPHRCCGSVATAPPVGATVGVTLAGVQASELEDLARHQQAQLRQSAATVLDLQTRLAESEATLSVAEQAAQRMASEVAELQRAVGAITEHDARARKLLANRAHGLKEALRGSQARMRHASEVLRKHKVEVR